MNYKLFKDIPILREVYEGTIMPRAEIKGKLLEQWLSRSEKILDVGSGNCGLVKWLADKGYTIRASDIRNLSFFEEIEPEIIENNQLPFPDKEFGTSMIITVLHHIEMEEQEQILREMARVSEKLIVMEDVFYSDSQESATHLMDSIVNLEFAGHPHSNRTEREWEELFDQLNLKIIDRKENKVLGYFDQMLWLLEPTSAA